MKKISLKDVKKALKRDEMRAITGGCGSGDMCDDWKTKSYDICYNCCITVHSLEDCASIYC